MKLPRCSKYIDRASMINSIEGKCHLDHELVEMNARHQVQILFDTQRILMKYVFRKSIPKKLFSNKNTIAIHRPTG